MFMMLTRDHPIVANKNMQTHKLEWKVPAPEPELPAVAEIPDLPRVEIDISITMMRLNRMLMIKTPN